MSDTLHCWFLSTGGWLRMLLDAKCCGLKLGMRHRCYQKGSEIFIAQNGVSRKGRGPSHLSRRSATPAARSHSRLRASALLCPALPIVSFSSILTVIVVQPRRTFGRELHEFADVGAA